MTQPAHDPTSGAGGIAFGPHPMRTRRQELGLSQAQLGQRSAMSRTQIVRIELRHHKPHPLNRIVLAAVLKADPETLFGDHDAAAST